MSECILTYEPRKPGQSSGELTGLVRYPDRMVDFADCWWVHVLAEIPVVPARTDGMIVPVRLPLGAAIEDVLGEVQRMLTRLCVQAAVVTHVSPPMTEASILRMQEINAQLTREILARRNGTVGQR